MAVSQELLDILVCPDDKEDLKLVRDGQALQCTVCFKIYRIEDDIPVMLIEEAEAADAMVE